FQFELLKLSATKHLATRGGVAEREAGEMEQEPVRRPRENPAKQGAAQTPATVSVAGDAHKITTLADESEHIVHDQNRPGVVGAENDDDVSPSLGDTGANGVDNAAAELVIDETEGGIIRLRLFDDGNAFVIGRVMNDEQFVR